MWGCKPSYPPAFVRVNGKIHPYNVIYGSKKVSYKIQPPPPPPPPKIKRKMKPNPPKSQNVRIVPGNVGGLVGRPTTINRSKVRRQQH
jgi:hypothetical protein